MHTASDASLAARHGTQEFWAHGATRTRILGSRCYKDTRIPGSRCYKGQNSPPRCYVHSRVLLCAQMYCTRRQTPRPARFGTILRRQEFWAHGATRTRILGSRCYKGQNSPPRCYSRMRTLRTPSLTILKHHLLRICGKRAIPTCTTEKKKNEETTWARCRALVAQRRFTQVRPLRRPVRPPLRRRGGDSIRTCGACLRRLVHMRSSQLTSRPPPVHRFVCAF